MAKDYTCFSSNDVIKMFPVSFERPNSNDRTMSEENLIDWFRSVTCDSCDIDKNSPFSYVVTNELDPEFSNDNSTQSLQFVIGGYYARVSGKAFSIYKDTKNIDIYATIADSDGNDGFRHLSDGDSINSPTDEFRALKFKTVQSGTNPPEIHAGEYRLHILTVNNSKKFSIPPESKRYSFTVDGGVV